MEPLDSAVFSLSRHSILLQTRKLFKKIFQKIVKIEIKMKKYVNGSIFAETFVLEFYFNQLLAIPCLLLAVVEGIA